MTAGATIRNNRWLHQDKQGNSLTVLTAATAFVSVLAVLLLRSNTEALVSTLILVSFVVATVVLSQSRTTTVEIDRDKGEVIKSTKYLLFTSRKRYRLQEFDEVRLLTMDESVEDGYRTIRYALVLSGKARSLELLSASSETEGLAARQELTEYIGYK